MSVEKTKKVDSNSEIADSPKVPKIKIKKPENEAMIKESWFTKLFMSKLFFLVHLYVYISVVGLCLMLNLMFFNGRMWVITMAAGWLVGLATHFTIYKLANQAMFTKKDGLKASFFIHLTVYLSVMLLLTWGNLAIWQSFLWVPISAFSWGIGLGVHKLICFYPEL
ncbi:MAG: 2TM domain-containing protein [Candidatus Helarchaeota archaeon]